MKRKQKEIFENWSENFRLEEDLNKNETVILQTKVYFLNTSSRHLKRCYKGSRWFFSIQIVTYLFGGTSKDFYKFVSSIRKTNFSAYVKRSYSSKVKS